jgi:hypothetical protein
MPTASISSQETLLKNLSSEGTFSEGEMQTKAVQPIMGVSLL